MVKALKKVAGLMTGLAVALGMFASSTPAFAANNIVSKYSEKANKIIGEVDLSGASYNIGKEVKKGNKVFYEGNVGGSVEASDLFEGAYNKYVADFKNKKDWIFGKRYENLVMFDYGQAFPSIRYTVTFPKNFVIDEKNITATENTATIGKIEKSYNKATNSVTFRFFLGSWNDYKGFFSLYEKEKGTLGHLIKVNIPYSVDITNQTVAKLGTISAKGDCQLYKYGGIFGYGANIVNIKSSTEFNVIR